MEDKVELASADIKVTTNKALDDLNVVVKKSATELVEVLVKRGAEICSELLDKYVDRAKQKINERDSGNEQRNENPDHPEK